jgi:hypothetical protein
VRPNKIKYNTFYDFFILLECYVNLDSRNESNEFSLQWWFWAHGFLVAHGIVPMVFVYLLL